MLERPRFSYIAYLDVLDPCIIMGLWRNSGGSVDIFFLLSVWSCANTYSVMCYG